MGFLFVVFRNRKKSFFCGYTYQASAVSEIYSAINKPSIHYNGNGGWHSSNPDSWTRANNPTPSTAKSIFDPCPYGYRVPTSNTDSKGDSDFFGFPKPSSWSGTPVNAGQVFVDSWWPAAGCRFFSSAIFTETGYYGDYRSASPDPSNSYAACFLQLYSNGVNPVNSVNRSYGIPVRCVQE